MVRLSYQYAHLDSLSIWYNSLYLLQFSHLQWQHTGHEYGRGFQEQIILSVQFQLVLEPMGLDFLCPEIVMRWFYWKLLQIPHFLSYFYHPTHLNCCLILHMQHTYGLPLVQMKVPALYLLQDLQQPSTLHFCKRHIVIILIIIVWCNSKSFFLLCCNKHICSRPLEECICTWICKLNCMIRLIVITYFLSWIKVKNVFLSQITCHSIQLRRTQHIICV